jgi:sirohydrochlorin ferrochelatase
VILLLAHGSRDARHRDGIERLARQVAEAVPRDTVRHAFFDFHGPEPVTAVTGAEVGETVWVIPLLMSAGVHLRVDVPAAVAAAQNVRDDLRWRLLAPLPVPRLAPVVAAYLQARTGSVGRTLVLVPAGSTRAGALAGIDELADEVGASLVGGVNVATGIDDLDLTVSTSRPGQWWLPVMYADGRLLDALRRRASGGDAEVLPPVGSLPGVADELATWLALQIAQLKDSRDSPG